MGWDVRRADRQRVDGTLCPARRRGGRTGRRCVPTSVLHGPPADRSGIPSPAVRYDYDPLSSEAVGPAGAVAQSVHLPPGVRRLPLGGAGAGVGRVLPRVWTAVAVCGRVLRPCRRDRRDRGLPSDLGGVVAEGPPVAGVPSGGDDWLAFAAGLRPCPAAVPDAAAGCFVQPVVELAVPAAEPADTAVAADMGLSGAIMTARGMLIRRTRRLRWTGQSRADFVRQHLTGSFYLYHNFSVIVAQPLSFTLCER